MSTGGYYDQLRTFRAKFTNFNALEELYVKVLTNRIRYGRGIPYFDEVVDSSYRVQSWEGWIEQIQEMLDDGKTRFPIMYMDMEHAMAIKIECFELIPVDIATEE